jgi:hypothetical protein
MKAPRRESRDRLIRPVEERRFSAASGAEIRGALAPVVVIPITGTGLKSLYSLQEREILSGVHPAATIRPPVGRLSSRRRRLPDNLFTRCQRRSGRRRGTERDAICI